MIYSPERLIQEWELPEVYRMEHAKAVVEPDEQPEGSTRRRTAVTYDDGMSEEQWLQVRSSLSLSSLSLGYLCTRVVGERKSACFLACLLLTLSDVSDCEWWRRTVSNIARGLSTGS